MHAWLVGINLYSSLPQCTSVPHHFINPALSNPTYSNQGTEYTVCVTLAQESKDMGLFLDRIFWFYWTMQDARFPGGSIRQNGIIFDSLEAPNGLTIYNCMRGIDICQFSSLLRADFYIAPGGKASLFGFPASIDCRRGPIRASFVLRTRFLIPPLSPPFSFAM